MLMTEINSKPDAAVMASDAERDPANPSHSVYSFQAVYRQYFDFVWSSARHLGAAADAVDDVVQDVFVVIHARLSSLQNPEALRSWVYGIVRRTVSNHRRSRRTREAAGARLGTELKLTGCSQPSPLDLAERSAELDLLERVLADIDEAKREIFVMVEVLEMTVPEVAQALEIPLNTAYSRLRLARKSFEDALAGYEVTDGEKT
jgi:RNA polymerase sigma-70 factor, ECF subfamily